MREIRITINGTAIEVAEGTSVLEACRRHGVDVPTLCDLAGHVHFTSCMVCVVKDVKRDMLIPACSAPVTDGMELETETGEVEEGRRVALELLLSEHVGDCEGPCQRVCPAGINIPAVIRKLMVGDRAGAAAIYRATQALPDVPCVACDARCEKPCRRGRIDSAVSIRNLMLYAVGDGAAEAPARPRPKRFNSFVGRLSDEEKQTVLALASDAARVVPADSEAGFTAAGVDVEAPRCLHCDCRKPATCRLRELAERYQCKSSRYRALERKPLRIVRQHPRIVYEPGKCIKCGICVKICEHSGERLGLAFLRRGYDAEVGVPFGDPLDRALTATAEACVCDCPTGALACREGEDGAATETR